MHLQALTPQFIKLGLWQGQLDTPYFRLLDSQSSAMSPVCSSEITSFRNYFLGSCVQGDHDVRFTTRCMHSPKIELGASVLEVLCGRMGGGEGAEGEVA
jgi:hypothetical protein